MAVPRALEESLRAAARSFGQRTYARSADSGHSKSGSADAGTAEGDRSEGSADAILRAAEQLLEGILAGESEARASALDLLTVDALVTRAMEIAARDPKSLADFPELAMKRIASR